MKKFFVILISLIVTTTLTHAQSGANIINPKDWDQWNKTTKGFPGPGIPGERIESKCYVFDSPVAKDAGGIIRPYMHRGLLPQMRVWIAEGGIATPVVATIIQAPDDDISWGKIFLSNRYAIPQSNDNGQTIFYVYNEPLIMNAYRISYVDENTGVAQSRYEIVVSSN